MGFLSRLHHGIVLMLILLNTVAVRYMAVPLTEPEQRYFAGESVLDFYQYFRGRILFFACVALLVVFLLRVIAGSATLRFTRTQGYILLYMVAVALSYSLSPYRATAAEGFVETYEGVSVLLSYGVLALLVSMTPMDAAVAGLYRGVLAGCFCFVVAVSLLQAVGLDPLKWPLVQKLSTSAYLPSGPPDGGYGRSAHGFFGNPNYLSGFFSLTLPFLYLAPIGVRDRLGKAGLWILTVLAHVALFASGSLSGLLTAVLGMPLVQQTADHRWSRKERLLWHGALILPLAGTALGTHGSGRSWEALVLLCLYPLTVRAVAAAVSMSWRRALAFLVLTAGSLSLLFVNLPDRQPIEGLTWFANERGTLRLGIDDEAYTIWQGGGVLWQRPDGGRASRLLPLDSASVSAGSGKPFWIASDGEAKSGTYRLMPYGIRFRAGEEGLQYLNVAGKPDTVSAPRYWGPSGYGRLGSSRVYIWQHSLPLLADAPLFGSGPDTFALRFPQNDVVSLLKSIGTTDALVTKAHNTYLNHGVNLGLLGLLGFAGLQLSAVMDLSSRLRRKDPDRTMIALKAGLILFAVTGLSNDSRVFIAVYHWLFIGLAALAGTEGMMKELPLEDGIDA